MKLKDWYKFSGTTQRHFSERTGIPDATLSRLANGSSKPSGETADIIYRATGGLVTANDYYGHSPVPTADTGAEPEGRVAHA